MSFNVTTNGTDLVTNVTILDGDAIRGNAAAIDDLDCPVFTAETDAFLHKITFWIEGVLCCVIAIPGFLGNIGSSYVLSTKGAYFLR